MVSNFPLIYYWVAVGVNIWLLFGPPIIVFMSCILRWWCSENIMKSEIYGFLFTWIFTASWLGTVQMLSPFRWMLFGCNWVHCAAIARIWHVRDCTMKHLSVVVVKRIKLYTFLMWYRKTRYFYSVGKSSAAPSLGHIPYRSHMRIAPLVYFSTDAPYIKSTTKLHKWEVLCDTFLFLSSMKLDQQF